MRFMTHAIFFHREKSRVLRNSMEREEGRENETEREGESENERQRERLS